MPSFAAAATLTTIVVLLLLGEAALARRNEQALRAEGAEEPEEDVYGAMRIAYPMCFLAMGIEGALSRHPGSWLPIGTAIFFAAKALKYWAIASLGRRWTFRVLTLPGAPLVRSGPYRFMRHPNYLAVVGELAGIALALTTPATGVASLAGFGMLLRRRIQVEERALAPYRSTKDLPV